MVAQDNKTAAPINRMIALGDLRLAALALIAETPRRGYEITEQGRAYLTQNRELTDAVLNRLTALGERVSRWRRALGLNRPKEPDEDSESLVEILARAQLPRK